MEDGQQNEKFKRECFCGFDANAILSTRVNGHGEDFWSREPERTMTSSLSGLPIDRLQEQRRRQEDDVGVPNTSSNDWKVIWKLEVPPKVRVLWWRVLSISSFRHKTSYMQKAH